MTHSGIEPATFRLGAQCLNQLRTPRHTHSLISELYKKCFYSAAISARRALLLLHSNKFSFCLILTADFIASSWRKLTAVLSFPSHSFFLFYLACPHPICAAGQSVYDCSIVLCNSFQLLDIEEVPTDIDTPFTSKCVIKSTYCTGYFLLKIL
jgi:hypothetical protein